MYSHDDLSVKMTALLSEIRDVMEKRNERIKEVRDEIVKIEDENQELENTIHDLLRGML